MSSYILEQIRGNLAIIESTEKSIVLSLFQKAENPKDSVITDHRIKNQIDIIQKKSIDALIGLNDQDKLKKEELQILQGQKSYLSDKQPDVWMNFYDRLKEIKEYHKRFPQNQDSIDKHEPSQIYEEAFKPPYKEPSFSGEENFGKQVDMHHLYLEFINLKKIRYSYEYKIGDYLWYLTNFDQFYEIPYFLKEKEYNKYKRYLKNLVEYLKNYFTKVQPLTDIKVVDLQQQQDFEYRWKEGTIRGWEMVNEIDKNIKNTQLYCKVCQKFFQNQNTFVSHFTGKKHRKYEKDQQKQKELAQSSEQLKEENQADLNKETVDKRYLAYLESYAARLKELLGDLIQETMNSIRKKQSRTYEEMQAENYENYNLEEDVKSESEEEGPIYNPKNLPLGWDGKPIPYWLYKLHGLGQEFKCEICGNYSYWGRRAFEKHFSEWRHAFGMKCLRIPNTIHFKEITYINDALALHQKLMIESESMKFKADIEEEFEDSQGNILNKKTYLDLKRQDLL